MKMIADINGSRQEFRLDEGSHIVGRDISCDITLPAGSVSRRHAEITVRGDRIRVRDLGSKNGTFMRGSRIDETELRPGEKLNIGHILVEFESETASAAGATAAASHIPPAVMDEDDEFAAPRLEGYSEDSSPTPLDNSFAPGEEGYVESEQRPEPGILPARQEEGAASIQEAGASQADSARGRKLTRREKLIFLIPTAAIVLIVLLVIIISGRRGQEDVLHLSRSEFNRHIDIAVTDYSDGEVEKSLERLNRMGGYRIEGDAQTHRMLIRAIEMDMTLNDPDAFAENWRRAREIWDDLHSYSASTETVRTLAAQRMAWIARESRNMALFRRLAEELDTEQTEEALTTAAEIPRDSMFFTLAHEKAEGLRDGVIAEMIRLAGEAQRARNWDRAIELYERAEFLSPVSIEAVTSGLAYCRKYLDEANRISQAVQHIEAGRAQDAERLLADIDETGPYHAQAVDLRLQAATIQDRRRAISLYNEGNASAAMAVLEDAGLAGTEIYRKMEDVSRAWERVESALARADFTGAEAACRTITDLETAAANRYRTNAREILDTLGDRARAAARARRDEGNRALEDGRLRDARDRFEEARLIDPDNQIGRAEIQDLQRKAIGRFNEALNMESRNPAGALAIYKDIRAALRIGDPYYERTLDAIDRMERD